MKILILSECYPERERPQYGIFIKQQAEELKKRGHEIEVLIPYRSQKHDKIHRIDAIGSDQEIVYRMGYTALRYDLFPIAGDRSAYTEISQLIEKGFDLVAVHITSDIILKMAVLACRKKHIPVVAHYHGLNVWKEFTTTHPLREEWYAKRRKRLLESASAIVGVSDKVSDIVRERLSDVPVFTVYNGVDYQLFQMKEAAHDTFRVIGVGNLIPIKGFCHLIKAFAIFYKKTKNTELHIIGEGVQRPTLEELANECGIQDAVTFHGKLPYREVAKRMRESDLFVLPSYYEALGCVYLEAMACGVPAVGVKGMGIDEIIEDGVNGYNVPPRDEKALAEIMQKLFEDRTLLKEMGKNARKTAERYSWAASAKALEQVYNECIKS